MKALAFLIVAALGCSSSSKPATTTTTTEPAGSAKQVWTGVLSEEEFKALHAPPVDGSAVQKRGEMIDLAGTKAYLSLPSGAGPHPAIVVIHEWWGLNDNIQLWADRLASAGWAAIAVDLYSGTVATTRDDAMAAMKKVDDAAAAKAIRAAIDFVNADARIKASKRAVIGWCFGGGWSLQTAIANPDLDGAIMYYGSLETDPAKLGAIKAQLLGVFGKRDKGIPEKAVDEFEAALKAANVKAEILRYDADHAFANPSNPHYDEANASAAWKQVLAFLDRIK